MKEVVSKELDVGFKGSISFGYIELVVRGVMRERCWDLKDTERRDQSNPSQVKATQLTEAVSS